MNYEPIVAGTQSNGFAGTKASDNAGQARKETEPVKDYILLPLWTADPPYSQDPKSSHDDGSKPSSDDGKKVDEDPRKESKCNDQEKEDNVNNTNNVNAASTNEVNAIGGKTSIELPFDPNMPALEDYSIFDFSRNDEDDGAEADMNNLDTTIQVSPIPTTRIHKDHPLDQVIGDLQSATQTRKMSKNLKEHGFVSTIQQRTNHKDLQNCLFACFLSQEEPKKVIHALKDPSWIEAMQEELLQFKLQEVWTLVDLPNRKRAIGTKWVLDLQKKSRKVCSKLKANDALKKERGNPEVLEGGRNFIDLQYLSPAVDDERMRLYDVGDFLPLPYAAVSWMMLRCLWKLRLIAKDEQVEQKKAGARKQEEEANIALIESWENTQAMMEADRLLAERLQSKEREELTDKEKAKLFMELMEKRRKHFAALRAQEKRNRPPTKAQKRTQMSTYLKHMGGYTYKQLKGKSFDEIQKLFDKEMKRVNTFVAMGSEVQESKEKKEEGREETAKGSRKKMLGRKRAVKEQQKESSKKLKVEEEKESEEVEEDDEVELKKLLVIKKDEDIAIDAIPLATKLPVIIDYKLHKEGMLVHYELIRADGSSKRYSSMIRMLQGIDREDLEALWRIVKAKYGDTRPEDEFERVLYGDLRVMFEPDIKSDVWRMLQGYRVTTWKLIDSSGVHFVRFDNLHIFMLVERRYPLTPITITNMLNKKLQTDHQNEMCYQLLKLMIQKMNIKFRGGLLGFKRLHGFLEVTAAQVWDQHIRLIENLLNDDSSPEELNSDIPDAIIESFSPTPIPVEDSDSLMEEIDIFLAPDDSIPPGIKNDDYDSEGDVLFLEELLNNDSISLPEYESFHVDFYNVPSSPRPPKKPPDDDVYFDIEPDTGVLTTKVVDDISERYVLKPRILPTQPTLSLCPVIDTLFPFSSENEDKVFNTGILASKEEKSPHLLSHRGFKAFQLIFDFSESPMMIYGGNIPILDVPFLHFYPP
ncbi:hypothetical protein Tco_0928697 [Tanacetum coccineum]